MSSAERNTRIKPDQSRSYLIEMPARYEQAKMNNMITKNLRKVAAESKQVFEGNCQVYTG
jgi:hypothetical protein